MSKRNPQINIRVPEELKDKITAQAEMNKRSVNAEIIAAIELSLRINGESLEPADTGLPEGFGHLLKTFKAVDLERLVNEISHSAAERAIKKLTEKNEK